MAKFFSYKILRICMAKFFSRTAMTYQFLLTLPDFNETETFMEDYAEMVGPVAQEMLLFRGWWYLPHLAYSGFYLLLAWFLGHFAFFPLYWDWLVLQYDIPRNALNNAVGLPADFSGGFSVARFSVICIVQPWLSFTQSLSKFYFWTACFVTSKFIFLPSSKGYFYTGQSSKNKTFVKFTTIGVCVIQRWFVKLSNVRAWFKDGQCCK